MAKTNNIINVGIIGPKGYQLGGYDFDYPSRKILQDYISYIFKSEKNKKNSIIGYCGLNNGIDYEFAVSCFKNSIKYNIYLANEYEEDLWISNFDKLNNIIKYANNIELLYKGEYSPKKNINRNNFIIENSDVIIYVKNIYKTKCSLLTKSLKNNKKIYYISL
jgi:uncharacterized phage-like protein YoqJ